VRAPVAILESAIRTHDRELNHADLSAQFIFKPQLHAFARSVRALHLGGMYVEIVGGYSDPGMVMRERRRRILVVEDDVALATMYRSALRFAGFHVRLAHDGVSALMQIDEETPDVVVLDLHLPSLGGEAILTELAANPRTAHVPVIVVSGADAQAAMVAQATAFLAKPCAPDRLLSVIERHLDPAA
jgi:CheY-like chemotaxis protein